MVGELGLLGLMAIRPKIPDIPFMLTRANRNIANMCVSVTFQGGVGAF